MSQPALSAQIRALEDRLKLTLIERRSTGAALTPVGRETLARARRVLEEARALVDFARGARQALSGRMRLGVSPTVGPYLLPLVVARLHRQHPELRLVIRESPPRALARELEEGDHDAVLIQAPVDGATLTVRPLFRERLLLLVAADHPLAGGESAPVEALAGLDVLTLDPRYQLHDQTAALCRTFGARLSSDYQGGSLDALRLMVGMGAGVAFAPELYARSEVRPGGDVVALPVRGRAVWRGVSLAWRRSLSDAAPMQTLGDVAAAAFAELTAGPLAR
jgi:LysR family hydrogen peroxide-inducible transcriptional activator